MNTSPHLMRAAVITEPGKVEIQRAPIPEPREGEVRIRLDGCGVCASNLPPFEGRPWFQYPMAPGALGHEGWGTVDAVGPGVDDIAIGNRVAALSQSAYAEFDIAPARCVVKLDPGLDGTPFPGEPLGCALNIFERAQVRAGDVVAIVGIGFLGALLTTLASHAGAKVIALARKPYALRVACDRGASHAVQMTGEQWQAVEQVQAITGEKLCDVVIECTGKQDPLDLSAALTGIRGRLVIAGYHQDGLRTVNLQQWNWRGFDVINAHEREEAVYVSGIRKAAEMTARGELNAAPLFTHRFALEDLGEALRLTGERPEGFMKAWVSYQ